LWNNRGAITIEENTISNAGYVGLFGDLVGGAIGLTSDGNVVQRNEIIDNNATGILVRGTADSFINDIQSATSNRISSNYFENNDGLDIDIIRPLNSNPLSAGFGVAVGDGMDALDGILDADTGSNGIDHPVLTSIRLENGVLEIEGSHLNVISNPEIELYLLGANDSKVHFATIKVADRTSFNPATGAFSAELTQPASGWPVGLSDGDEVAALAIDGSTSDTSEFGLATSITLINEPANFDAAQSTSVNVLEGTPVVATIGATDPEGSNVEFSIVGGADASSFEIDSETGELSFVEETDFENPGDADSNNSYSVRLRVQDEDGSGTERDFNVVVNNNSNEIATISQLNFEVDENQQEIFFLEATAPDGNNDFTYEIVGGQDSSQFTVVANPDADGRFGFQLNRVGNIDGALPDFENPRDSNQDNIYELEVRATNDSGKWE